MKCSQCGIKEIENKKGMVDICISCYPTYINKLSFNCEEKGHSRLCKCPENPLNKKLEHDANEYVSPVVTAADFPEPGLKVDEFLETITNEKDQSKLKAFFDKHR